MRNRPGSDEAPVLSTVSRVCVTIAAAVAVLLLPRSIAAGVEYVTTLDRCHDVIDRVGDGRDLVLKAGQPIFFEVWGNSMDLASNVRVGVDSGSGSVTASIILRRNGLDNNNRGCGLTGSAQVRLTVANDLGQRIQRSLYFRMPLGDESRLQLAIEPDPLRASDPNGPDLQPTQISLASGCGISFAIRNNGPGAVPEQGFGMTGPISVSLSADNQAWGGSSLGALDPHRALKNPGGQLETVFPFTPRPLTAGLHTLTLSVASSEVRESNERNNTLTRTVTCSASDAQPQPGATDPQGPDLQPTRIALADGCRIVVTLRNNGPGVLTDQQLNATILSMQRGAAPWGGFALGATPSVQALKNPGGQIDVSWLAAANLRLPAGISSLKVDVKSNNFAESNELNNSLTRTVTCTRP